MLEKMYKKHEELDNVFAWCKENNLGSHSAVNAPGSGYSSLASSPMHLRKGCALNLKTKN